ncbi:hypothetical protein [Actinomadura latina]|uniref:Uncharacterized protein n=1 Tax=Actinomadura latina TaxID=163603 RepID=A0A846Z189_9ACTN|nr:hypothetical protein [Actinomadura latina]NKZ06629.1 hypothetical protein [Actinomadura latina]
MKRGHVAVLVLVLALSGCGGSDGGGESASAPPSPAVSAPASAPSGTAPGKGNATPVPEVSRATERFNDCMHKQGVELPTPNPSSTPAKKDLEKIKAALQTCVKSMSASPPPAG